MTTTQTVGLRHYLLTICLSGVVGAIEGRVCGLLGVPLFTAVLLYILSGAAIGLLMYALLPMRLRRRSGRK